MQSFIVRTKKRQEIIEITERIKEFVAKSKVNSGTCFVYTPHTTAAILINENYDKGLNEDIIENLERLIPSNASYKHNKTDDNAHAHIKASIIGPSETILIKDGKFQLGRWQGIAFCEFDGPRERKVYVKIIKD